MREIIYFIGYEPSARGQHTDKQGRFPVKVGITLNVRQRLLILQTANPYELDIYATCTVSEDAKGEKVERWVHEILHENRMRGEWFLLSKNEIGYLIQKLRKKRWFSECNIHNCGHEVEQRLNELYIVYYDGNKREHETALAVERLMRAYNTWID